MGDWVIKMQSSSKWIPVASVHGSHHGLALMIQPPFGSFLHDFYSQGFGTSQWFESTFYLANSDLMISILVQAAFNQCASMCYSSAFTADFNVDLDTNNLKWVGLTATNVGFSSSKWRAPKHGPSFQTVTDWQCCQKMGNTTLCYPMEDGTVRQSTQV